MLSIKSFLVIAYVLSLMTTTAAFCAPSTPGARSITPFAPAASKTTTSRTASTALFERRWNFNEGQGPWGMKKNAEIWNGRVAQMAFVLVFLQELIQGKGVVQGITEGDPINLAGVSAFAVVVVGLTGWLALQGDDDYVARDM